MIRDDQNETKSPFDWAAIGRWVRQRTLEAVAAHFALLGDEASPAANAAEEATQVTVTEGHS